MLLKLLPYLLLLGELTNPFIDVTESELDSHKHHKMPEN